MPTATGRRRDTRGAKNAFKPTKEQRLQIVQQRANGATLSLICRHFKVSVNTLKKACADELAEGKQLHEGILLGRMAQLGQQNTHPSTAFSAVKWQLSALHGRNETTHNLEPDAVVDAEEVAELAREGALAKLAPYLKISEQNRKD